MKRLEEMSYNDLIKKAIYLAKCNIKIENNQFPIDYT